MDIDCQSDYIELRDGNSEDSPLMGTFCGNGSNVPDFMQTTQNNFRIRWKYKYLHCNPGSSVIILQLERGGHIFYKDFRI